MSAALSKVVAITGASGGIAKATARSYSLNAERNSSSARAGRSAWKHLQPRLCRGGEAIHACTDVKRRGDLTAVMGLARERFGRLDALVNNVGIGEFLIRRFACRRMGGDGRRQRRLVWHCRGFAGVPQAGVWPSCKFHLNSRADCSPDHGGLCRDQVAVRAIFKGLRQGAGETPRVTIITLGFIHTDFVSGITDPALRGQLEASRDTFAMTPDAIARIIAFAIEQPPGSTSAKLSFIQSPGLIDCVA